MRVIAMQDLFYGAYRRAGTEFDINDDDIEKYVGEEPPIVLPANPRNRERFESEKAAVEKRFAEGAIQASGTKGNARKRGFVEAMRRGDQPLPHAAQAAIAASGGPAAKAKMERLKAVSAQSDLPVAKE